MAAMLAFGALHERYAGLFLHGYTQRGVGENLLAQVGGVGYLVWKFLLPVGLNIDPALPVDRKSTRLNSSH